MKTLLIRNIGQLVTLAGPPGIRLGAAMRDVGVRTGVDLLIEGSKISGIVEAGTISQADEILDAQGGVVLPGFVDAHTHACFAGSRIDEWQQRVNGATYEEIATSGGGILSTVTATRAASEQLLADLTVRHLRWMIRNGTTCAEVKSGYGLDFETERKMLSAISRAGKSLRMKLRRTYLGAHAIPAGASESDHVTDCLLAADSLKQEADYVDMFVEEGYFSHASCRRYAATRSFGLPLRLHIDQLRNSGGAVLAAEVQALTADHLEYTDDVGIRALADAGVLAGLLPGSVFGLRKSRYADGRKMIDAGVGVYLATDFNPGSSPVASLPFCMRLAVDHMGMSIEEALVASTINPAVSLGLDAELGSIEPSKRADLCVFPVSDYRDIAYFIGIQPSRVIVGGKLVDS